MPHRPAASASLGPRAVPVVVLFALALFLALPVLDAGAKLGRDNDRDGLSNKAEKKVYKTNWRRKDTDGDRLGDGAEVLKYRTSPLRTDTDRDRLSDWREIKRYHTNPRRKDTDGDGLRDGAEVRKYKTSPRRKDTDGDGIADGVEVLRGLDPLVKNGTGDGGGPTAAPAPGPAPAPAPARGRPNRVCTTVVSSTAAAQAALAAAAPGAVICLADGVYGQLGLSASKAGEVIVQPQNPGRASIAGARLSGSNVTISRFTVTNDVQLLPGSDHLTVEYNRISGGYFGVDAGPTTNTPISDTTIRGNTFQGPFGEDALRINRYHDGPDADPYGILVEGNEITGVRENGNHSDCLQSVWGGDHLYFRRNYLHDNRCQGFFVKDQPATVDTVVVEDNLFLRNGAACDPAGSGCGQPSVFQLFGPMTGLTVQRNTIWTPEGGSPVTLRESGWGSVSFDSNVLYRVYSDTSAPFGAGYASANNVVCKREGTWPTGGITLRCPTFPNPGAGDYRLAGVGVTWALAEQSFGP